MDGREAWLLREAARKRASGMGLHEWAEDIAQETVLRFQANTAEPLDQIFQDSLLYVVMTNDWDEPVDALYLH